MVTAASETDERAVSAAMHSFAAFLEGDELEVGRVSGVAHPINRGLDGLSIYLRKGATGKQLFLKILHEQTMAEVAFADARDMTSRAGKAGIGPRLIASNKRARALLMECLTNEWRFATVKDFRNRECHVKAIEILKSLHCSMPLDSNCSMFERIHSLRFDLDRFAGLAPVADGQTLYPELYRSMCDWIEKIETAFDAAGHDTVACHVENSLSNFMIGPSNEMKIVDFDRATNSDPLSDLGILCNEYCRTDHDVIEAAEIYTGGTEPSVVARIKLYMIGSAFHLGLWGIVSQYRSPTTAIEFFKYGQNQFLRCLAAISGWDVGRLLREM